MASGSISGWGEGVILSIAFVAVLTLVITNFNIMYGKNYGVGLDTEANASKTYFVEKVRLSQNETLNGEVIQTAYGVQPKNSFGIVRDFISGTWSFLNGAWLDKIGVMIGDESVMVFMSFLRVLFVMSLIFAFLYTIFKVVA